MGAAKKPPNLESHLNVNDERLWLAQKGVYAVVDWSYFHMWKQLYAVLIGCIAGFQCHAIQIDQNKNQNRSID